MGPIYTENKKKTRKEGFMPKRERELNIENPSKRKAPTQAGSTKEKKEKKNRTV